MDKMSGNAWKSDEIRSVGGSDTTPDFSNSHVRSRWEESIHEIMKGQEEKRKRKEQEMFISDEFGEQVARILNQTPEFHGPLHKHFVQVEHFQPLLSRRNLQALRQHLTLASLIRIPAILVTRVWDACCFLTKNPKTLRSTLLFFITFLIVSMTLVAVVCHKLLVWLVRTAIQSGRYIITLMIDMEDLKALCPNCILRMCTKLVSFAKCFDNFVLFGRRHAGREWSANAHLWKGDSEAQSRTEVLWKCPPPSVQLGRRRCLDANRMPLEWSNDTKKHVLGINFCYVLLRADHIRRQKKYERMVQEKQAESNARRAAFARARSQRIEIPSLRQRGLLSNDREDSNEGVDEGSRRMGRSSSTLVEIRQGPKIRTSSVRGVLESVEVIGDPTSPLRQRTLSETDIAGSWHDSDDEDTDGSSSSIVSGYTLDDLSLTVSPKRTQPSLSREVSIRSDESDVDLDWLDVGTRIGLRLLNSEHVQKAVASQETAERIYDIGKKVESQLKPTPVDEKAALDNEASKGPEEKVNEAGKCDGMPSKPLHSMWTSPASAVRQQSESSLCTGSSSSGEDEDPLENAFSKPLTSSGMRLRSPDGSRPPLSPYARQGSNQSLDGRSPSRAIVPKQGFAGGSMADGSNRFRDISGNGKGSLGTAAQSRDKRALVSPLRIDLLTSKSSPYALNSVNRPSSKSSKYVTRRPNLQPGTKVVVPILPKTPGMKVKSSRVQGSLFQMATVVKSRRIHLPTDGPRQHSGASYTNCLSVTVKLDKSFLRGADFAEMTFRVRDEWSARYMPRHSKFPIGACVATSYGLGVLVGWRVEDDVHVIGSLWQHRGAGMAYAYLNRDSIHGVIEASVGFDVETNLGRGTVVAYVHPGKDFRCGRFFVHIKEGRSKDQVLEFARSNILSCLGAKFLPVIELLREAAQYQLLVDRYKAALRRQNADDEEQLSEEEKFLRTCSKGLEILWASFLKAVEEDKEFDQGLGKFVNKIIGFLEGLDGGTDDKPSQDPAEPADKQKASVTTQAKEFEDDQQSDYSAVGSRTASTVASPSVEKTPGFWFMNDWFGGIFQDSHSATPTLAISEVSSHASYIDEVEAAKSDEYYKHAFAIVRSLMRTVSIARASCANEPNLRLALSISYEFLIFVNTVLKVQQRNVTQYSLQIWKRALEEIADTFGPIKERLQKIGTGLAERIDHHGKKAKVRILRFVDAVLSDECLMVALERDDWQTSIDRVEDALVKSKLLEEASRVHIHKTIMFIYNNTTSSTANASAAARYGKQLAAFAAAIQRMSSPRRAFLTVLRSDTVLDLLERLLVRVFRHDSFASRMLMIHASNFQSLRQLRMLKGEY